MSRPEKLEGGFINQVFREDGVVAKEFGGEALVRKSCENRLRRERHALVRFGGSLAPIFLGFDDDGRLLQEFLPGGVLEGKAVEKDYVDSGTLLSSIHSPVACSIDYIQNALEKAWDKSRKLAAEIMENEGLELTILVDWEKVSKMGATRVHRDFWFGNIIRTNDGVRAIDWEFAGIGSPYEDLAIVELWIFREYERTQPQCREWFVRGYGKDFDQLTIIEFLKAKCVEFLATTNLAEYLNEDADGFYHNKVKLLKELV